MKANVININHILRRKRLGEQMTDSTIVVPLPPVGGYWDFEPDDFPTVLLPLNNEVVFLKPFGVHPYSDFSEAELLAIWGLI